jgi:hypothetical protein
MKYQFCIRFNNVDANSAASKAVLDCNKIFSAHGYSDYTFTVGDNSRKPNYYFHLAKELFLFFLAVKRNSLVGIQYPLLSINNVFKYFIAVARFKKVRFFCVVHDIESLRAGGKSLQEIKKEVANLSCYDAIIVHNNFMIKWLRMQGLTKKMVPLDLFDYLTEDRDISGAYLSNQIVYAGNLSKSTFIYKLPAVRNKKFVVFGPNFRMDQLNGSSNVSWGGEFSPSQIPRELVGGFGLIWDGISIDKCDEALGNYLKYNNPHKLSLYIAAGLPVIVPDDAAIAMLVKQLQIGILIGKLQDIDKIDIGESAYQEMKKNVLVLRQKVIKGAFFSSAIQKVESYVNRS